MSTDNIEQGDYVAYTRYFDDGIATGMEQGTGYISNVSSTTATVINGDRVVTVPLIQVRIRAKQYRLDV